MSGLGRSISVLVTLVLCFSIVAAQPASANPAAGGTRDASRPWLTAAPPPTATIDMAKWPANLKWALPGTKEFTKEFIPDTASAGHCTAANGGDPYLYAMNYLDNVGAVFQSINHSTGSPVLAIANHGAQRMDLPALSSMQFDLKDGQAMPPLIIFLKETPRRGAGVGPPLCGRDLAPFGEQQAASPFGFAYFNQPDSGSKKYIDQTIAAMGSEYTAYWKDRNEANGAFDPRNLDRYCDPDNPFCLTAAFLHCDAMTTDAEATDLCHAWNYNVGLFNLYLYESVTYYGVNRFDAAGNPTGEQRDNYGLVKDSSTKQLQDAGVEPLGATTTDLTKIASTGLLSGWALAIYSHKLISYINTAIKVATVGAIVLFAAATGIGAFWLGFGLLASLAISALATYTVFGDHPSCGINLSKCLAEAASEGFRFGLSQIPNAANSVNYPRMTTASWRSTFNDVGSVSLGLLIVLFLLNLIFSLFGNRMVMIVRSVGGVVAWALLLTAGGAILTLMLQARDAVTAKLGGTGDVLSGFGGKIVATINAVGGQAGFAGWLFVAFVAAVGMILALIVFLVLFLSAQWLPLIIAILVLQAAALAAPGLAAGKWFHRGFSLLWTLLITPPIIVLIWRVGTAIMGNATNVGTLLIGLFVLLLCAFAPTLVAGLFSLGVSGRLGGASALLGAAGAAFAGGKALQGLASAASKPGKSSGQLMGDQLASASHSSFSNPATVSAESAGFGGFRDTAARGAASAGGSKGGPSKGGGSDKSARDGAATADPWAVPAASSGGRHANDSAESQREGSTTTEADREGSTTTEADRDASTTTAEAERDSAADRFAAGSAGISENEPAALDGDESGGASGSSLTAQGVRGATSSGSAAATPSETGPNRRSDTAVSDAAAAALVAGEAAVVAQNAGEDDASAHTVVSAAAPAVAAGGRETSTLTHNAQDSTVAAKPGDPRRAADRASAPTGTDAGGVNAPSQVRQRPRGGIIASEPSSASPTSPTSPTAGRRTPATAPPPPPPKQRSGTGPTTPGGPPTPSGPPSTAGRGSVGGNVDPSVFDAPAAGSVGGPSIADNSAGYSELIQSTNDDSAAESPNIAAGEDEPTDAGRPSWSDRDRPWGQPSTGRDGDDQ